MRTSKPKKRRILKIRVPVPRPTRPHKDGKKYDRKRMLKPGEQDRDS